MMDVKSVNESQPFVEVLLYGLEPFTKYAVYIQMYTISMAHSSAMSPIKYFTTSPSSQYFCICIIQSYSQYIEIDSNPVHCT